MNGHVQLTEVGIEADSDKALVNDFQIVIATVNGTGSQTANTTLVRTLFGMGIPVTGKNVFPSNIQGLPTWFYIRLNKDGYTARRDTSAILVAMNLSTVSEDIKQLPPGGVCVLPEEWGLKQTRDDISYYPVPVKSLISNSEVPSNLRDYVSNMIYVGVLSFLLNIELAEVERALEYHFGGQSKAAVLNNSVVQSAFEWAAANLIKSDPYIVKRMDGTRGMILLDGNSAGALGAVFGGVNLAAWYPITPSTSLIDALREYLSNLRHDPETGKATYVIIQAEDELAAVGMVVGAGWAGARAMTATSGPGISLMSEYTGLAYFAEVPVVIWDVQRVGPATGLPTRTSQSDVLKVHFLGHGDTKHVCLLPGSIEECFEFGWRAFDLAERLQTPVFVLSDLDLGMNTWLGRQFEYPDRPMDRGKVLTAEDLERLGSFARYEDVDGDGISYRTLPGTNHPKAAYFARGTGHNLLAEYSESPQDWVSNMERLKRKFDTARQLVPEPVVDWTEGVEIGIIAYGSTNPAVAEARDRLAPYGVKTNYLRIRALPFNTASRDFVARCQRVYVVEANTDGQMASLLRMEYPEYGTKFRSLAHSDGLPLTARWIAERVLEQEKSK
jgi:2-oxoglutarate ferredoxin oxidoreductase subunit alpha